MAFTRRYFLKSSGIALASFAAAPSFLVRTALAQTKLNAATSADRPVVIAIFQRGAADGISMVVPFGDKHYTTARPQIAIAEPSRMKEVGGARMPDVVGNSQSSFPFAASNA